MSNIYRDQGDTGPLITGQFLINGSPITLASIASMVARVGGTITGTYVRYDLPGTWNAASGASLGFVFFSLNPSGLYPSAWPCATPGRLQLEFKGIDSAGVIYHWPARTAIPFIVRTGV